MPQGVLGKGDSDHSSGQHFSGSLLRAVWDREGVNREHWRESSDGWQGRRRLFLGVRSDLS